jgi:hypothetical protein
MFYLTPSESLLLLLIITFLCKKKTHFGPIITFVFHDLQKFKNSFHIPKTKKANVKGSWILPYTMSI